MKENDVKIFYSLGEYPRGTCTIYIIPDISP